MYLAFLYFIVFVIYSTTIENTLFENDDSVNTLYVILTQLKLPLIAFCPKLLGCFFLITFKIYF